MLTNDQGFTGLNETIIVFLILITITYLFFLITYFCFFYAYKKEIKIKNDYNKIVNSFKWNNISYLQTLSSTNKQLKYILRQIIYINDFYEKQVDKIKLKIVNLTKLIRNFHFFHAKHLSDEIIKDVNLTRELNKIMNMLYSNAINYNETSSTLISYSRFCYDKIHTFYYQNLLSSYFHKNLMQFDHQITEHLIDANVNQQKINNDKLINSLNNINELLKDYYKAIKYLYIYDQLLIYLRSLKLELDDNLANQQRKINATEFNNLLYLQSNVNQCFNTLNQQIKNLEFEKTKLSFISLTKQLQSASNLFKNYDRILLLSDNALEFSEKNITEFNNNLPMLEKSAEIIHNYFQDLDTKNFEKSIEEIKIYLKKINLLLNSLKEQKNNLEKIDHLPFLKQLLQLSQSIYKWSIKINSTYQKITSQYRSSIALIDDLYQMQWKLNQYIYYINISGSENTKTIENIIRSNLQTIDQIIKLLTHNFDASFAYAYQVVNELKEYQSSFVKMLDVSKQFKNYSRLLILFANKYRYENESIASAIDESEKQYEIGKYTESINTLLPILQHIKLSANKNHIKFN